VSSGDRVSVLDGVGHEYICEIREGDRREVRLGMVETRTAPPVGCRVTLLQALPKGKLFESIIQKATELGAARIVPLLSERVVVHLGHAEAATKAAKWRQVAIEAIKQCGALWLPEVELPVAPHQFLARAEKPELSLAGSLQANARHPRECFEEFERAHQRRPNSVSIWIGPEGDFTPAELSQLELAGVLPITLGRLVLRAETAAIYCLSMVNYVLL
jgi:16S rRNA (uracil1498-N3)-methyltransferase